MGSNSVTKRCKSSACVQAAVRSHADAIARSLGEFFGEETGPAVAVLLDRIGERLEVDTNSMIRRDDELLGSIGEDPGRIASRNGNNKMLAMHDAVDQYDRTFEKAAHLLSVLLNIAGQGELARQVRPSKSRAGLTAELADDNEAHSAA